MANFFSKIKLPTAVDKRTHFDLSCDHVTTMDWFSPKISYIKEMVPNESIEIKQETFTRLAPMTVPTFGRINMIHRAFFVPMRTRGVQLRQLPVPLLGNGMGLTFDGIILPQLGLHSLPQLRLDIRVQHTADAKLPHLRGFQKGG